MNEIKIRASALGHIMVGAQLEGSTQPLNISEQKIIALEQKKREAGKPLTEKQQAEFDAAVKKRDTPFKAKLSDGALTHVQNMWYGARFEYQKRFTTAATRKGNARENEAINQVAQMLGIPFAVKNERFFENDYTHGMPDWLLRLMLRNILADTKCPWLPSGLDLFEQDKLKLIYQWQVKAYQWLTGFDHGLIIRVLMNPPESEIYGLALPFWEEAGFSRREPITEDFLTDVREMYNFERRPIEDRVKIIRCDIEPDDPKLIIQQVELMRKEWVRLDELAKDVNKAELDFLLNRSSS